MDRRIESLISSETLLYSAVQLNVHDDHNLSSQLSTITTAEVVAAMMMIIIMML